MSRRITRPQRPQYPQVAVDNLSTALFTALFNHVDNNPDAVDNSSSRPVDARWTSARWIVDSCGCADSRPQPLRPTVDIGAGCTHALHHHDRGAGLGGWTCVHTLHSPDDDDEIKRDNTRLSSWLGTSSQLSCRRRWHDTPDAWKDAVTVIDPTGIEAMLPTRKAVLS